MSVADIIHAKLTEALAPVHLEVINESHMHNVPKNSETHFKVVIASAAFTGQRLIGRHRAVNAALADELAAGVHALSMHTYTPEEWQALEAVPSSPKCRG
ncbi:MULTISPECIES: BolA family protein [Shewanella]|jgi:BolA protein|uniref:DNA-binding transcriptional regulator BolA n=2 Tax=Shewanella TaxID=22 RepID=A0AAJ1BJ04_9GAMM|nr:MULTISPECIES: BolA/IbaG family iron-sulfur metabolism protein [Shewanella]AZQ11425.1 transcriptional regulator BolA [Shewanella khirikhana]MCH4295665.1 BolA/IbaG family iron-sulfur metabolism protein [Shewanella zhuhaiensis]